MQHPAVPASSAFAFWLTIGATIVAAVAPGPTSSERILDTIEWLAKLAGALVIVWGFLEKVAKPYGEWRRRQRERERQRMAEMVRDILREELTQLEGVVHREGEVVRLMSEMIAIAQEVFRDLDDLLKVARDNHDRLDETNLLLDETGFTSDRRKSIRPEEDKTAKANAEMMEALSQRQSARRRRVDVMRKRLMSRGDPDPMKADANADHDHSMGDPS